MNQTMEAECTMICLDNSHWPLHKESPSKIMDQVTAIEHYFRAKIQSNPENTAGIVTTGAKTCISTGERSSRLVLLPTNDFSDMEYIHDDISQAGSMDADSALYMANTGFIYRDNIKLPRRIILFAGGDLNILDSSLKNVADLLKSKNVALDVVSIGEHEKWTVEKLKALVAAVDNKGNSHIVHVPSASYICQAIMSPPIFSGVRETYEQMWPPLKGK